jgi:hypothetical protein
VKKPLNTLLLILILLFLAQADLSAQCAMCKQAAESSMRSNPNSMARSLNSGILYLMAVPYLLIAFIFRKQIAQLWRRLFRKGVEPLKEN